MDQKNMYTASHRPKNLVILGAGGFAREVAWLVADVNNIRLGAWNVIGFWQQETERTGQAIKGVPILTSDDVRRHLPNLYAVVAIGNPRIKIHAVEEAETLGCHFATLIHPTVQYDASSVEIGPGSIICAGSILTVNVTIGAHVIINLDCTIGHDSIVDDFVTISPGCQLSGYTRIRDSAFLGTGAVTIEGCEIGAGSIIGAGAVVVRNIPAGVTALGIPAKAKEG